MSRAPLAAIARGGKSEFALECTVEGGLGFVAGVQRHLEHGVIGRFEQSGAELHAAARKIGEGRLAQQPSKSLRKHGA